MKMKTNYPVYHGYMSSATPDLTNGGAVAELERMSALVTEQKVDVSRGYGPAKDGCRTTYLSASLVAGNGSLSFNPRDVGEGKVGTFTLAQGDAQRLIDREIEGMKTVDPNKKIPC